MGIDKLKSILDMMPKIFYDENLLKYLISIDELEQKTGIDFFCNLPDKTEDIVEKTVGSSFRAGLK